MTVMFMYFKARMWEVLAVTVTLVYVCVCVTQ